MVHFALFIDAVGLDILLLLFEIQIVVLISVALGKITGLFSVLSGNRFYQLTSGRVIDATETARSAVLVLSFETIFMQFPVIAAITGMIVLFCKF